MQLDHFKAACLAATLATAWGVAPNADAATGLTGRSTLSGTLLLQGGSLRLTGFSSLTHLDMSISGESSPVAAGVNLHSFVLPDLDADNDGIPDVIERTVGIGLGSGGGNDVFFLSVSDPALVANKTFDQIFGGYSPTELAEFVNAGIVPPKSNSTGQVRTDFAILLHRFDVPLGAVSSVIQIHVVNDPPVLEFSSEPPVVVGDFSVVPEPTSGMLILGAFGIGMLKRRRMDRVDRSA